MGKPLIPAQRRERIQEYLVVHQIARTIDLMDLLETSEATVRRDLEWMETEGILERTHGGAILNQRLTAEPEYLQRLLKNPEEKKSIGKLGAELIQDGDIVFINSGTTTTQVIHNIRNSAGISVFTNNLNAPLELGEPGFQLHLLGGEYQYRSKSSAGSFAIKTLGQVYASKSILGVDGISLKHGCTVPTSEEAEVVRHMIERTRGQIIVVADHSKWGVVSNFQVATIDEIAKFVTDAGIDSSAFDSLAEHSVECLASPPQPVKV